MYRVNRFFCYLFFVAQDHTRQAVCAHVARLLREERQRQGLSMDRLAEQSGLSQAMISFVERELRNPTLDTLLRITRVLNLDLSAVLKDAGKAAARQRRPA